MASTRRAFLAVALSGVASHAVAQTPEDAVLLDLPPKSSLWGAAMFFVDDLVEVHIASAKDERAVTGRGAWYASTLNSSTSADETLKLWKIER